VNLEKLDLRGEVKLSDEMLHLYLRSFPKLESIIIRSSRLLFSNGCLDEIKAQMENKRGSLRHIEIPHSELNLANL
jgi:hypothetical protein